MQWLTIHKAAQLLIPSTKDTTLLLHEAQEVRQVAMELAAATVMAEGTVLWVEAANQFDLYAFTEAAKRWGRNPKPFLQRIHVARAFTLYQLGTLCPGGLEDALKRHPGALTVLSDPLALCWDAEVPWKEAERIIKKVAAGVLRLRDRGYRIVLTSPDPPEPFRHRAQLVEILRLAARRRVAIRALEPGVVVLQDSSEPPHQLSA